MVAVEHVERHKPPVDGSEAVILWGMLDYYRATLLAKCAGLSDEDLARSAVPPSELSLLGLLRHSVQVELYWFERVLVGGSPEAPYSTEADHDADFHDLGSEPAEVVVARYLAQCERSRELVAGLDLSTPAAIPRGEDTATLRYIGVHLLEEYARHVGHADLLREAIDGATGD